MQNQADASFEKHIPEFDRLTKSIARKEGFVKAKYEDLFQDVLERLYRYREHAIQNGSIHYGYARKCILSVIAQLKEDQLKSSNWLKSQAHTSQPKQSFWGPLDPDTDGLYILYGGDMVDSEVLDGNMEVLPSHQTPFEEIQEEQLYSRVVSYYESQPEGKRKDVLGYCLSGMTDGGSGQGKDIAKQLGINQKSASQALSYVRKDVRKILHEQTH